MIETDILFAHLKEKDWLKDVAEKLLLAVDRGKLGTVYASRESIHELYYLLDRIEWTPEDALSKIGALTRIRNVEWLPTTTDTDLLALSLIATYDISSIFDAYHAATCLLGDPEHIIVSTDAVYDKIPRIKRIEPKVAIEKI